MNRCVMALILLFLVPIQSVELVAQDAPKAVKRLVVKRRARLPEVVRPLRGLMNDLIEEGESVLVSPFHYSSQDAANTVMSVALLGVVHVRDPELLGGVRAGKSDFLDFLLSPGDVIGNPVVGIGAMATLYSLDFPGKTPHLKDTLETAMHSGMITSSFVLGTQLFVQRESPELGNYQGFHSSLFSLGHHDYRSFPSLYTAFAFSTATTFSEAYPDTSFVPILSYGLAALVGWSQAYDNKHWVSDVVAGAMLGTYTAHHVGAYRRSKNTRQATQPLSLRLGSPVGLLGATATLKL